MRVVVATDQIGSLRSAAAGAVVATGWPDSEVVPIGVAGAGFVTAYADQLGLTSTTEAAGDAVVTVAHSERETVVAVERVDPVPATGIAYDTSSAALGDAVLAAMRRGRTARLVVDLTGLGAHDGGAGFLGALGATADADLTGGVRALERIGRLDLTTVTTLLAGMDIIGVVPEDQLTLPLLGLRGITSRRGREAGEDAEILLATDAALERYARLLGPQVADRPGAGACGGLGVAILALGGRLTTGPDLALERVYRVPDLVVTGCERFDFATRGGGVVAASARQAAQWLVPCIAVAGEVLIGGREMRTLGIEAAYAVHESRIEPGRDVSADRGSRPVGTAELTALIQRISRSWRF